MKTIIIPHENIYIGNLVLVNRNFPYREQASKQTLVPVDWKQNNIFMEKSANTLFLSLMNKIDAFSKIVAVSGWRSTQEQEKIYAETLKENGTKFTQKFVALPNHSEHQTGLAIDVGLCQESIDFICPQFPNTGICQEFRDNATVFGFIERYPKGKEHITGIGHEPWHFRYVGFPHSMIMQEQELTLEEYIDFLKQYSYEKSHYKYESKDNYIYISYIRADKENCSKFEIENNLPFLVSGNNVDGFIITEWRKI